MGFDTLLQKMPSKVTFWKANYWQIYHVDTDYYLPQQTLISCRTYVIINVAINIAITALITCDVYQPNTHKETYFQLFSAPNGILLISNNTNHIQWTYYVY